MNSRKLLISLSFIWLTLLSCSHNEPKNKDLNPSLDISSSKVDTLIHAETSEYVFNETAKTIHIKVALCDNKNQGIVPVPASLGNGQQPNSNLYWGAAYGIKTYFKKSKQWSLVKSEKLTDVILERAIFKHTDKDFYIVADAYDGAHIKTTTTSFLKSSCGMQKETLVLNSDTLGINGNASLVAYIGHNGLMDFSIYNEYVNTDERVRDVIILACVSKGFFEPHLSKANVNPLVWSTNLMAPEAYIIHDALEGYVMAETNEQIRDRAARAYSKFQKCSLKAAKNLLVTN